jgi:RND family efflux transporter MFP subunit
MTTGRIGNWIPMLLAAAALGGCGEGAPRVDKPRPVLVETVRFAAGEVAAAYPGEVRARRESDLAFRIGGKIVSRRVDAGDVVRKGQSLARLDPSDVALSAQAAKAQWSAAENDFRFAEAELNRSRGLLAKGFVSQTAFDGKNNAFGVAKARVEQARAQGAVAGNQAGYADLIAESDGVITAVSGEAGQVVAAGQAVMRLAQPGEKEIWISVPESRLEEMHGAPTLSASLWAAPTKQYLGRVREIAPNADPVTRTFQVKVALPDADEAVRLGMTANVLLRHVRARPTARLPLPALGSRDGKPVLWIVDGEGRVQPRVVEVAEYLAGGATILSGVAEGDRVVVAGVHKLGAGERVEPQTAPAAVNPSR